MNNTSQAKPISTPNFREAIAFWFKLGFISFGGPAGQIATVHQELVENKRWISEKRFLHALNYCMILPGPEALQLIIYMGWLMHRTIGGLIAGIFFIFPAILLLITLSILYVNFGQTDFVAGLFLGIKPAVTAIVIAAGYRISKKILKKPLGIVLAIAAFLALQFELSYPMIIASAGLVGYFANRFYPNSISPQTSSASNDFSKATDVYLIGDHTVQLEHTRFSWQRFIKVAAVCIAAWVIPFVILSVEFGGNAVFTKLAWFFTKAALLTFGGAYAVLPYVFQSMVDNFHYLSPSQMMDGLALGETTPGPLIIVVTFVGFVAAHAHQSFLNSPIAAGVLGAVIVSWFTFLPSFFFILVGAPFIESTRQEIRLTPILNAITCAVVGVIASLAIFFAIHTLVPENHLGNNQIEHTLLASAIIALASMALIRYQQSIPRVIFASALIGWIASNLGLS